VTSRGPTELYLVDSSGWLEYLAEDSKAAVFGHYIEAENSLLMPTLVIYEVYKQLAKQRGRTVAERFMSQALHYRVIPLDDSIAIAAANASVERRLSTVDSIVYATARAHEAQLVTANTQLRGLPGVIIP
jgi:toxin FitB